SFLCTHRSPHSSTLFPYTTLFRSEPADALDVPELVAVMPPEPLAAFMTERGYIAHGVPLLKRVLGLPGQRVCRLRSTITVDGIRSEEHTSELQSRENLVCRLLLEK